MLRPAKSKTDFELLFSDEYINISERLSIANWGRKNEEELKLSK
jgi:hypothetical protein